MVTGGLIAMLESALVAMTTVGILLSAVLTIDSTRHWLRVRRILPRNLFPRMHLRNDLVLLLVQILMAVIGTQWIIAVRSDPDLVMHLTDHAWAIFPLRVTLVAVVTAAQIWNARDRYVMLHRERIVTGSRAVP